MWVNERTVHFIQRELHGGIGTNGFIKRRIVQETRGVLLS